MVGRDTCAGTAEPPCRYTRCLDSTGYSGPPPCRSRGQYRCSASAGCCPLDQTGPAAHLSRYLPTTWLSSLDDITIGVERDAARAATGLDGDLAVGINRQQAAARQRRVSRGKIADVRVGIGIARPMRRERERGSCRSTTEKCLVDHAQRAARNIARAARQPCG